MEYYWTIKINEVPTHGWISKILSEKNHKKNTKIVWSHLYDMCRVGKPVETEGRLLVV